MSASLFSFRQPANNLLLLAGVLAALALGAALVAQFGFDLHPCELCMLQRYPYMAVILFSLTAFSPHFNRIAFTLSALCAFLFLIDSGVAYYHTGVELGWFPGPSACTNSGSAGDSLEEMRRQIMNAPLVPCNQAMAHIFGLSIAAWNAITAFGFYLIITIGLIRIYRRG